MSTNEAVLLVAAVLIVAAAIALAMAVYWLWVARKQMRETAAYFPPSRRVPARTVPSVQPWDDKS